MKDLSNENILHIKKEGIEYLQFKRLLEYPQIIHAYSLGTDKNYRTSTIDKKSLNNKEYQKAINDYKALCEELDINYINIVKSNQEHTDNIRIVDKKINKEEPDFNLDEYSKTDGLITNKKGYILSTTNADCILMIFYDPVKNVIANIHSGWKGTVKRISIKTVEKMVKEYDSNVEDIICCICPSIRKCHFEVDSDVKDIFIKEFSDIKEIENKKIIEENIKEKEETKKWNIDTVEINKVILMKKGLKKENIIDSNICSVCESDLIHSYRVEKQGYGLSTVLVSLQ